MADTHTNVLVRMTGEMKGRLQREALLHDLSLTKEITTRLHTSLNNWEAPAVAAVQHRVEQAHGPYVVPNDKSPVHAFSDTDRAMLAIFRAMPVEKQLALLSLFK